MSFFEFLIFWLFAGAVSVIALSVVVAIYDTVYGNVVVMPWQLLRKAGKERILLGIVSGLVTTAFVLFVTAGLLRTKPR